jgi:hypothetical protein
VWGVSTGLRRQFWVILRCESSFGHPLGDQRRIDRAKSARLLSA